MVNKKKNIKKAQNGDEIVARQFQEEYIKSPKYKERLKKQGYQNINQVVKDRLDNMKRTEVINNPFVDMMYHYENPNDRYITYGIGETFKYPPKQVLVHELSHSAGAMEINQDKTNKNLNLNYNEINQLTKRNTKKKTHDQLTKERQDGEISYDEYFDYKHEQKASENKAYLDELRFRLKQDNIYDAGKEDFNKDILNKAKNKYKSSETLKGLFKNYSDEDLTWLMNNIAMNDISINKGIAQNGSILTNINPKNWGIDEMIKGKIEPINMKMKKSNKKLQQGGTLFEGPNANMNLQEWLKVREQAKKERLDPIQRRNFLQDTIKKGKADWEKSRNIKPIKDNMGQWAHPGKVTQIDSNKITMEGVKYPVLGVSDTGDTQLMLPEQNYQFHGDNVTEYPMAKNGKKLKAQMGINLPGSQQLNSNAGYFNQQNNSLNWGSKSINAPGQFNYSNQFQQNPNFGQKMGTFFNEQGGMQAVGNAAQRVALNESQGGGKSLGQSAVGSFGPWGAAISAVSQGVTATTKDTDSYAGQWANTIASPSATFTDKRLSKNDRIIGGFIPEYGALKKLQAKRAMENQEDKLKSLGKKAKDSNEQEALKIKRKYFRPEEQLVNPDEVGSAYGTGSNFLAKNGTELSSGQLQVHNGGYAETISENPYLPDGGESVLFRGQSHDNGGIDISFGKNKVEVEGGEPAMKMENGGNLVIFGNMKIPDYGVTEIGDDKAKGKKFKNYINELNTFEAKQNNIVDKNMKLVNDTDSITPFDKLKLSSGEAMLTGANMNLKNIAKKKEAAANVQNAILDTAEEYNLDSDALAKGNIKKAKKGTYIKAQDGAEIKKIARSEMQSFIDQGWQVDPTNENRLFKKVVTEGGSKTVYMGAPGKGGEEFNKAFAKARSNKEDEFTFKGKKYTTDLYKGSSKTINTPGSERTDYMDMYDPNEEFTPISGGNPDQVPQQKVTPNGKRDVTGDIFNVINYALPFLRPSNKMRLDPNQLAGERYALENNQLDGVKAQLYNPLLEQYTDISLQDQLNANQADFNAISKNVSDNPAALASLAGQKYMANSNVLGEQFRTNQNQKMNTFNKNRNTLNDAQMKNLGILDQQYVRQAQAKTNTKNVNQAALSSISSKIQQNKLENRTLGIYENTYNYRYLPGGQAVNLNGFATWNMPQVGENPPSPTDDFTYTEEYRQKYDKLNNPSGAESRTRKTTKSKNGSLVKYAKSL